MRDVGPSPPGVEVPELTARVARAANPAGTTAMWVRDRLDGLWDDEDFAGWYPRDGRPALREGAEPPSQFAPAMRSAALAPITMLGAWVCPRMMVGITDASATRSLCTPRTSSRGVTTLAGSVPIRQVPTG